MSNRIAAVVLLSACWCANACGSDSVDRGAAASGVAGARTGSGGVGGGGSGAGASGGASGASVGGASGASTGGGAGASAGGAAGSGGAGGAAPSGGPGLGTYPVEPSETTDGGTMTFTNVGAPGWWPRRIDRDPGDPACDYKDGTDTWGGHCCMTEQHTSSTTLAPFDEEMTLLMKAVDVKQLAVYQPTAPSTAWEQVSAWDRRQGTGRNLSFTEGQTTTTEFSGDLTRNDCLWYAAQESTFDCGDGRDYYCPNDPGVKRLGWKGSKLVVLLASMTFDDAGVRSCDGDGAGHPGPWIAFVASELIRDGGRKWNGLCNCYSKTGSVGDGCGEINVFEVVMDNNDFSNREFISTGVRSFQAGHAGGNVCGSECSRDDYGPRVDVLDACAQTAYAEGPELEVGGMAEGCPVWRRPIGDRFFMILLDEMARQIQVAIIHPSNVPSGASVLLPTLPGSLPRAAIDDLLAMRLPH